MPEQPKPQKPDEPERFTLELLRQRIDESPERMENERKRTGQGFMPCFSSRLQAVLGALELGYIRKTIEPADYEPARARLDELIRRFNELRREYQGNAEPPAELKAELMAQLDILPPEPPRASETESPAV